ncbi:hypothetical protein F5051DRAFT_411145 [Lentinula edodes]|nr:hypothetical protein F5051DRAFT_411145 [Lentinula edodes]
MGRKDSRKTAQVEAAARARLAKTEQKIIANCTKETHTPEPVQPEVITIDDDNEDLSECGYEGGVNFMFESDSEFDGDVEEDDEGSEWDSDEELQEYDAKIMEEIREEVADLLKETPYEKVLLHQKDWKKVEKNRSLGYNGHSIRSKQREDKKRRDR